MNTSTKRIEPDMTVHEIMTLYPDSIELFNTYGIDTCCGSGVPLSVATERDQVDLGELLARLRRLSERG